FPEVLSKRALKRGMETSLKRFSTGFLKTVALYLPPAPQHDKPGGKELQFNWLRGALEQEHSVTVADLEGGVAPENADLLMLAAPHQLDDKQLFAVDQFLMQGGTVIVATSPYDINLMASLTAREHTSGLHDWLVHHGI